MNLGYINGLPEVKNKFNIELEEGEKVVFTAQLDLFGTEQGRLLGTNNSKFTLTNKRMILDNGVGIWTVNIAEDIISCEKTEERSLIIFKQKFFLVKLNTEITFGEGEKLTGFRIYFKMLDMSKFEKIANGLFGA